MKRRIPIIAIFLIVLVAAARADASCKIPEAVADTVEYSDMVCAAAAAEKRKQYATALRLYQQAAQLPLHEVPNYKLFARMALMHYRLGDKIRASEDIKKSDLALSVSIGHLRCFELGEDWVLIHALGGNRVLSPHMEEIAGIMCGAAYENLYTFRTFDSALNDAELIRSHLDASRQIGAKP